MQLVVFSKMLKNKSVTELIEIGHELGIDGYDLCVRPGYPINPDNAHTELIKAVELFAKNGLCIPMITGNFDLLASDHPTAEPILAAMDKANVRLLKLGYFSFNPLQQDYWKEVEKIRLIFTGWQKLAERYNVKICYHTHSNRCMGLNCGMLAHLLCDFDPRFIGAYIDPGHMVVEGEEFAVGVAIIKKYLSIVGLKDVLLERGTRNNHGTKHAKWVKAGEGMVDWTSVFSELSRIEFTGPLSIHCEMEVQHDNFLDVVKWETRFFREQIKLMRNKQE